MPGQVAPWLEDLSEDWVAPPTYQPKQVDQSSHDEAPDRSQRSQSRIPRRSSGAQSNLFDSVHISQKRRSPLAELSSSAANVAQESSPPSKLPVSRSVSVASAGSAGSVIRYGTVERKSKSSSPEKKPQTLEWKKRLIDGELGYGDQTDLFGPSGLENIFQSPTKQSTPAKNNVSRPGRLFRPHNPPPSSPPPWPSSIDLTAAPSPALQRDQAQQQEPEDDVDDLDATDAQHTDYDDQNDPSSPSSPHVPATSPYQLPSLKQPVPDHRFLQPSSCHPADRTVSGQTDLSGEAFSPVFISKHTTTDGRVNYATLDSKSLNNTTNTSELNLDDAAPHESSPESVIHHAPESISELPPHDSQDTLLDSTLPSPQEVSLPDNLPTGTPPIAALGDFVNVKRGGLSAYGSFNLRPLSPSQSSSLRRSTAEEHSDQDDQDDQDVQSEGSVRRLPRQQSPTKSINQERPTTPMTTNESSLLSPPKTRPSASPLKLFGNYDTFTNNKLLRRMSQLEDLEDFQGRQDTYHRPSQSRAASSIAAPVDSSQRTQHSHRLSSFGEGELDQYDFEADLSIPSGLNLSEDYDSEGSPPPGALPPGSKTPFRFHVEDSPDEQHDYRLKRKLSKRSTAKSRMSGDYGSMDMHSQRMDLTDNFQWTDGKRPRSSPSKAPTPKRRRTIVALNGALPGMEAGTEIQVKITGASTDGSRSTSIDDTASWCRRNMGVSRPRNPTPSQYRREQIHAEIDEATMHFLSSSPRLEAVKETLDLTDIPEASLTEEQAKSVAAEVAAFTLRASRYQPEGRRSRSITTQDFLDEAMHIMSLIRARGRPRSNLGSVVESEAEDIGDSVDVGEAYGQHLRPEDVVRSPSPLRLSRPPSREGGSTGWRPRSQASQDPRVVSQLRKFQEQDDGFQLVESSLRSLDISDLDSHHDQVLEKDTLSPVRIRGPRPESSGSRRQSSASQRSSSKSPTKTHQSNPSLDSTSSRRTVGTHSTQKSENVANLAPEKIAHLIPVEIAGMQFDKDTQKWVRIKDGRKLQRDPPQEIARHSPVTTPSHLTSEDDPFNDIPDLTVDEMKELTRIGRSPTKESLYTNLSVQQESRINSNETVVTRPVTRENQVAPPFTSSSAPSKYSVFGSSQQQQVDTRATSWSNEELARLRRSKAQASQTGNGLLDLAHENMSHPISDIPEHLEEDDFSEEQSLSLDGDSETEELPAPKPRMQMNQPWVQSSPASVFCGGQRPVDLRRQTLNRAFCTTAEDQHELSFVATLPDKRTMSVSFNLSKPSKTFASTSQELTVPSSSPQRQDATFYLSDLPEFTVNEDDEERPSERTLAKRIAQHASGDRYAMAIQGLVKTLTDVEPDEPYWEDIKQLSLADREVTSVHNLEDFCNRLEDLDLSDNNVAHLDGAPSSIRRLNVRSNALSSLTAWSHLMNLQYLDISGNVIDSLAGLCMLVHLREVRADDNHISSLDGILGLDGLLKLSVRRNKLASVDFEGCQLKRLEELDLSGNQLSEISQVDSLPSLSRLVLDDNELTTLTSGSSDSKLTSLSLKNNRLRTLDGSPYPGLRYLNVDENQLVTINGLENLHRLDVISMRKQQLSTGTPLSIFGEHLHARSLYLSSNSIATLELPHSYHSVQDLELSSCGLSEVPLDFGIKIPNLRTLNLSFNAIKDLRPLLNIAQLQTLHIPGNRISRLRKTVATLARMQHLRRFDARDNPITLGFYPPTATAAAAMTTANTNERSLVPSSGSCEPEQENETQIQQRAAKSFTLPTADLTADNEHCTRLDEDAKLRRRVYELLLSQSSRTLDWLDGLAFDRFRVVKRDSVWDRLVEIGVMRKSGSDGTRVGTPVCELEV